MITNVILPYRRYSIEHNSLKIDKKKQFPKVLSGQLSKPNQIHSKENQTFDKLQNQQFDKLITLIIHPLEISKPKSSINNLN